MSSRLTLMFIGVSCKTMVSRLNYLVLNEI